ncbi:MAG: LacI family DNA-binding transcriptional regulator [Actinomycetes bacterium]
MASTRRTPVMADVAERAGVSMMTVSRVLSGHPNVTAATRDRVLEAVEQLGYRANLAARSLAGGRSHVLGAISVQPESWGPSRTVSGIEVAAQAAGQLVSFRTVWDPSAASIRGAIDELRSAQAEGIILVARVRAAVEALAEVAPDIPVVITYPTAAPLSVGLDNVLGARLATRHLIACGHREVVHVRGPKGWIDADDRAAGWRRELRAAGCTGRTVVGDWTPGSGYEAGRLLAADPATSAVFVANDQMALGVMLALHDAGRSVPGDVSVVGFDDVPEAGFYLPPLTTVRQDFAALGRASVERVLAAIDGEQADSVTIEPELVVRSSTAAPRSP